MKKFNSVVAVLVFAVFAVFLAVEGAEAFCIYNNTDAQISVEQTSGHKKTHGFVGRINPGDNKCCNWQNSDCNKEGKKDSTVRFGVSYKFAGGELPQIICKDFPIKAGGWLTVEGSDVKYKCVAHE